jgi:PTS system mannose-specific IIA component
MTKAKQNANRIGVVVVTHVDYGRAMLDAAATILGTLEDCVSIDVDIKQGPEEMVKRIEAAADSVDNGAGVLILTDMFGGTPTNVSLSLLGSRQVEVITGVNLPMLLKVLSNRSGDLSHLAEDAKSAGCQGIVVAGEILRSKVGGKAKDKKAPEKKTQEKKTADS